jgi:hypothetical protein
MIIYIFHEIIFTSIDIDFNFQFITLFCQKFCEINICKVSVQLAIMSF